MKTRSTWAKALLILTFGALLLCGTNVHAQGAPGVRYGLTMGLNMGRTEFAGSLGEALYNTLPDRLPQAKMRYGWVAEFFTANDAISIVTGVDYRMSREKFLGNDGLWFDRMGTCLTVPVLFKYTLNRVKGVLPFFELGPQTAFVLSFTGAFDPPGPPPGAIPMEMTQYSHRVIMELRGGAGIEYPMGTMYTGVIEAGYEYGLTDSVKLGGFEGTTGNNLFFTMGIRF